MGDNKWNRSFYGVVFLAIGALGLLKLFGILPRVLADLLVSLWPLALVYIGVNALLQGRGMIWSAVCGLVGMWLILINFGFLPTDSIAATARFWPFVLALVGAELFLSASFGLRKVIGLGIFVLIAIAGVWVLTKFPELPLTSSAQVLLPSNGAGKGGISYQAPISSVDLILNPDPQALFHAELTGNPSPQLNTEHAVTDGNSSARIKLRGIDWLYAFYKPSAPKLKGDLPGNLALALEVRTTTGNQTLDLHNIDIETLTLASGAGKTVVYLDSADGFTGTINNFIGGIELHIPASVHVKLTVNAPVINPEIPAGYRFENGAIYSPEATDENAVVQLTLSQPFGAIKIIQSP